MKFCAQSAFMSVLWISEGTVIVFYTTLTKRLSQPRRNVFAMRYDL